MDDLIHVGIFSIFALYVSAFLAVVAAGMILMELAGAVVGGYPARVAEIVAIVLIFLTWYAGTGLWLRHIGRI